MAPNHPRQAILHEVLSQFQGQITEFQTLLSLLCLPLAGANLLPPRFRGFNTLSTQDVTVDVAKVFPQIQRTLLVTILPTWETILEEHGYSALTLQYFCPDAFSNASSVAGDVALCAYSTILSLPLHQRCVDLLLKLAKEYSIDRLFHAVCTIRDPVRRSVSWDDCLRDIFAVPSKIANALRGQGVPADLGLPIYYDNLSVRIGLLIRALSKHAIAEDLSLLTQLFSKLAHVGAFPSSAHPSPSQSSFFHSALPSFRCGPRGIENKPYHKLWNRIMGSLPSVLTQQVILASLFSSLTSLESTLGTTVRDRGIVHREATLLCDLVGNIGPHDDLWNSLVSVILTRSWGENHSRVFVCWLASGTKSSQVQGAFLSCLLDVWSAPEHIKHSLLSRHQYISTLLLLIVTHFPQASSELTSIATHTSFLSAIGTYIDHPDASVRRCGMLVAEVVAGRVGKNLKFDDWEGDDDGRTWARHLRQLCSQRDIDFGQWHGDDIVPGHGKPGRDQTTEVVMDGQGSVTGTDMSPQSTAGYDSDDSLTGYASSSCSRSPSPTSSELQEIENDPTLHVGQKKILRPVYLVQLSELIRNSGAGFSSSDLEADRIEMAINVGEELIRRKRDYGTELAENAATLTYGFLSLQNKFDLYDFDYKQQRIAIALVACCPQITAQCMVQEFFRNQYSSAQRLVMLNALTMGARELASLPIFPQTLQPLATQQPIFLSKTLPPSWATSAHRSQSAMSFTGVAAEWFIMPLVNRFWTFLRDEQTREERTAQRDTLYQYHGAGTGLILSPLMLSAFLDTMAILVHASQNAPQWPALIAPNTLELAITVGSRQISRPLYGGSNDEDGSLQANKSKEASVLTSALNLALIILDGSLELDGGHSLGLEHTALLFGMEEWAGQVFNMLEKGIRVTWVGGTNEVELRKVTAGVLLKVDQITSRWRRSMVDVC